jgi:hypothetical protein
LEPARTLHRLEDWLTRIPGRRDEPWEATSWREDHEWAAD